MKQYFYIDKEGKQRGTFTAEELNNENLKKDTLVWTQGMDEWMKANDIPELQFIFESHYNNYEFQSPPQDYSLKESPIMPKTWMIESILVTILPFLLCGNILSLIGIIAIINASKVETLYRQKLFLDAETASSKAGKWTKITLWIAIGAIIIGLISIGVAIFFFGSISEISNALSI